MQVTTKDIPLEEKQALFERIFRENKDWLLRLARHYINCYYLRSFVEADDLFQNTMTCAWKNFDSFDSQMSPIRNWLGTILKNLAKNCIRDSLRGRGRIIRKAETIDYHHDRFLADEQTPLDNVISSEEKGLVRAAIRGLPSIYREVLEATLFENLSSGDISVRLGISIGAVTTRIHRARVRLRKVLVRQYQCKNNRK